MAVTRTITASAEIDRLFGQGRRITDPALLVLAARTPEARDPYGRVLFVAGKKLGGAVVRNRSKRVMREALRIAGGPAPGWDIALVARRSTASTPPSVLASVISRAMAVLDTEQ